MFAKIKHRFVGLHCKLISKKTMFPKVYFGRETRLLGVKNISIGHGTSVSDGVWINCHSEGIVNIQEHVHIGRHTYLSAGKMIDIGKGSLIGSNVRILSQSHYLDDPTLIKAKTQTTARSEITIGDNCWIGESTTIVGNVSIGNGSIVGAGSVVSSNIPPYTIALGNPIRFVKRFNPHSYLWEPYSSARYDYRDIEKALAAKFLVEEREPNFLASSTRYGWS